MVAANPQYPALLYNVACAESLAGRKAEAIEHLRLALEASDGVRPYLEKERTSTRCARSRSSRPSSPAEAPERSVAPQAAADSAQAPYSPA